MCGLSEAIFATGVELCRPDYPTSALAHFLAQSRENTRHQCDFEECEENDV